MKINRAILSYLSVPIVGFIVVEAVKKEQWAIATIIATVYLAFAFGIDKFIIDWKNKKVEINDTNKE